MRPTVTRAGESENMESALQREYFCRVEKVGPGDLAAFRDVVLTYSQALRNKSDFYCAAEPQVQELLRWLGVEWREPKQTDTAQVEGIFGLPDAAGLPATPLQDFRQNGYLGRTLFAALVRSSYGPEEEGYFPTASELGFYFEPRLLRAEIRWDQEYLDECQRFFFEELTPAELLQDTLNLLPAAAVTAAEPFSEELQGVLFLVGEEELGLRPLRALLHGLLVGSEGGRLLQSFCERIADWRTEEIETAWQDLPAQDREALIGGVLGGQVENAVEILTACGRRLLEWRAAR